MTAQVPLKSLLKMHHSRKGDTLGLVVCAAVAAFGILVALLVLDGRGGASSSSSPHPQLLLMAAAGLREPVEEIAARYEREHGVHVDIQFGGSNSLLNQLQVDRISAPDLFLAADQSYTQLAVESGLADRTLAVATQRPVVIVRKDSSVKVESLDDLFVAGLRLSIGDPDQAAIGRTLKAALQARTAHGWEKLERQVAGWGVSKPTVNDVANDVQIGAVDAGIVWNTTVAAPAYQNTIRVIELPELSGRQEQVTLAVLNRSKQPAAAWNFARYLTASDRGLQVFRAHGFGSVQPDMVPSGTPATAASPADSNSALPEDRTE